MSCCPTDKSCLPCDYTQKGAINEDKAYVVTAENATIGVLVIPDIFGMTSQAFYVADQISERLNAKVVIPDVFAGKPWPKSDYPPKDYAALGAWIGSEGAYEVQKPRFEPALNALKAEFAKVGLVGFCLGGKMVVTAQKEGIAGAVAAVHPAKFTAAEFAEGLPAPVLVIASKDEDAAVMDAVEADFKKDAKFGPLSGTHYASVFDGDYAFFNLSPQSSSHSFSSPRLAPT
jgi:dienelactone hydrolase